MRDARRLTLGEHGPIVMMAPHIADMVAGPVRALLEQSRGRASSEVLAELEPWVVAVERSRAWYRRALSDDGTDRCPDEGTSVDSDRRVVDGVGVWSSSSDAADRLGVSVKTVGRLLKANRLHGRKVGHAWLIDPASLEEEEQRRSR